MTLSEFHASATFIGVNVDPTAANNTTAADRIALPGTQTWEPRGLAGDVERRLAVGRVPIVYVFDIHGQLRGACLPRELEVLLGYASK